MDEMTARLNLDGDGLTMFLKHAERMCCVVAVYERTLYDEASERRPPGPAARSVGRTNINS